MEDNIFKKYFRGKPKELSGTFTDLDNGHTGTTIKFKPDHKIFETLAFGGDTN